MALPKVDLLEFVANRLEPKFRAFPGDFPMRIAREIALVAIGAQREFMESARASLTESVPGMAASQKTAERDPSEMPDCSGTDARQQTLGA